MLSPLFSQSDFTFSYHKLKITWQFHHYAPRLAARKTNCSWLVGFKTCVIRSAKPALPCKKSLNSPKAKDISLKTRDISLKARDFSQKTRDILKPKAVLSVYTEDAAELPLLKCNKIQESISSRTRTRVYTLEFYVFCCHICHSILQVPVKHGVILFSRAFDHMKTQRIAVTHLGAAQK